MFYSPSPIRQVSSTKLEHINCIISPTIDKGGLYLGDRICLIKQDILKLNRIQAIITLINQNSQPNSNLIHIRNHLIIPAQDTHNYPLSDHFHITFTFINNARNNAQNILVHCHAGISRSVTIVCAYLIHTFSWTPQKSLAYIRSKRKMACPNENFWNQLQKYYHLVMQTNHHIRPYAHTKSTETYLRQTNHKQPTYSPKKSNVFPLQKRKLINNKQSKYLHPYSPSSPHINSINKPSKNAQVSFSNLYSNHSNSAPSLTINCLAVNQKNIIHNTRPQSVMSNFLHRNQFDQLKKNKKGLSNVNSISRKNSKSTDQLLKPKYQEQQKKQVQNQKDKIQFMRKIFPNNREDINNRNGLLQNLSMRSLNPNSNGLVLSYPILPVHLRRCDGNQKNNEGVRFELPYIRPHLNEDYYNNKSEDYGDKHLRNSQYMNNCNRRSHQNNKSQGKEYSDYNNMQIPNKITFRNQPTR